MRAGSHALSLLSVPLNVHVLLVLAEEPKKLIDLRRAVGSPPQTTMRGQMQTLTRLGIVERRREPAFPASVEYALGPAGRDLATVLGVLQTWLSGAPDGELAPGTVAAKSAIKALVDGWSSTIVRALAAQPLSLTELSRLITSLSYPSLERRLSALRLTQQIEPRPGGGRGTPYGVTNWLRRAVAPLAAAARWERRHAPRDSAPIGRLDVESAFLLSAPLLQVPGNLEGTCRLAVELRGAGEQRLAGVRVGVKGGRVVFCSSRLAGDADARVTGTAATWLRAAVAREPIHLEVGGDAELGEAIVDSLSGALVGVA